MKIGQRFRVSSILDCIEELFCHLTSEMVVVRTSSPLPTELSSRQPIVANAIRKVSAGTVLGQRVSDSGGRDGVDEGRFASRLTSNAFPVGQSLNEVVGCCVDVCNVVVMLRRLLSCFPSSDLIVVVVVIVVVIVVVAVV